MLVMVVNKLAFGVAQSAGVIALSQPITRLVVIPCRPFGLKVPSCARCPCQVLSQDLYQPGNCVSRRLFLLIESYGYYFFDAPLPRL